MIAVDVTVDVPHFRVHAGFEHGAGLLAMVGPSGSGKTLTLRAIAGLTPASGTVQLNGRNVANMPTHQRGLAWVPQQDALFPFTDVLGNVTFALPRARRTVADPAVAQVCEEVGIQHLLKRAVVDLSGGERQRVALARALVGEPLVLLLDEPFAALDDASRTQLGAHLRTAIDSRGLCAILVSHDPREVRRLADCVLPFSRGQSGRVQSVTEWTATLAKENT
ncbi:MAG: ABC-type sulfate/molybdate transport systems ATPase subunit [Myxococcota bacterium]|jgi:ABC-type sulfate/molybdate transport systems ATPase subunit